jgi:hypothetical protein
MPTYRPLSLLRSAVSIFNKRNPLLGPGTHSGGRCLMYRLMPTRILALLPISVLLVCGAACQPKSSAPLGFMVDLATSEESCGDGSHLIATAVGGHRAKLNAELDRTFPETVQRLREVMSYRAERVVYVRAEAGVSWGEFMELIDEVWPEVNVVSILTPQVEAVLRRTYCLGPSCSNCTRFGGFHTRTR